MSSEDAARSRFANEYRCGPEATRLEVLDRHTFRVSGCGSSTTYTCIPQYRRGVVCVHDAWGDPGGSR